jgi:hypothetical protein
MSVTRLRDLEDVVGQPIKNDHLVWNEDLLVFEFRANLYDFAILELNRAGGFQAEAVFDLSQEIASVSVSAKMSAQIADGETFGSEAGEILVASPDVFPSLDGLTFSPNTTESFYLGSIVLTEIDDSHTKFTLSARYLKVSISLQKDGVLYAGANDPEATVEISISYT